VLKLIERHRDRTAEEIIERHAEQLRRDAEQAALPVDVELVASVQGIKPRRATWDFAGRIYADIDGQLVMDLNNEDRDERQRFTCAHELMHLAFPGFKCDIDEGLDGVERLAKDADVSLQAAGNRLASLADRPSAFLVFDWSHKPADRPQLRRGEDVPKCLRLRYASVAAVDAYLPRFKSVEDSSTFGRAWHGARRERGRELLPGAERLGAFDVEAQPYGANDRRVVLAVARRVT
jgi:hypothetical protein